MAPDFDVLASGFKLAEGPTVGLSGSLWVADTLGGGVRRVEGRASGVSPIVPERRGIGGLVLVEDGTILASGRDIARIDQEGAHTVLAHDDPRATGFNDLGAGPDGELIAGTLRYRPFKGEDPVPGDVLIVDVDGRRRHFAGTITWPNGIAVSDTGWAYIADFATGTVLRAKWSKDGNPELKPWWNSPSGQVDGLALDQTGAVLVAMGMGAAFARVLPDGSTDRIYDVPAVFVSSLCFAGDNLTDLIVTTAGDPTRDDKNGGRVLRLKARVPGLPVPSVRALVTAA